MLLANKQVAIIGGGPAGLTLGRLLQEQGVQVKVYERDMNQHLRQQGSTLDLHQGTGLKAIEAAGLMNEFKKRYRPGADKAVVTDSQMRILMDEHEENKEEGFEDALFRPEIDRGPLRDMLVASLHPGNIVWDARFTDMIPSGDGWLLRFENGTTAYADLVIAADGANSKLRKYLTDIAPVYSGVTDIEGSIPNAALNAPTLWQLVKGGSLFALENGKSIKFITKGDGTLTFLIGQEVPETWITDSGIDWANKASVSAWFQRAFADWDPRWQELFAAEAITVAPRPWYHYPADQHWEPQPNLTMIGDAAHRVPAYAGEGANQALADAVDLYEALCCETHANIGEAIASFEQKMLARCAPVTQESVYNTLSFHTTNNQAFILKLFGKA